MKKISSSEVKYIAKLANLNLTEKETEKFKGQLSDIVSYVDELQKVDTKNVEPTSQTTGLENVSREDTPYGQSLTQDEAISGGNKVHNGYFVTNLLIKK